AEFSITGGYTWYDISAIPPGSGSCTSHEACEELTGKTGYNVAMSIAPDTSSTSATIPSSCATITCDSSDCADAYLYPTDDGKVHDCPDSLSFTVTFCPDGSSSTTSSATQGSTSTTTTSTTTTTAPAATTATPSTYTSTADVASDYDSGTVTAASDSTTTTAASTTTTAATTSTSTTTTTSTGSAASFSSATISSSFVYNGTDAGSATGTYGKVTAMSSCTTEDVSVSDPVGPFSEEVTMVFRGPMNIYNIAVFNATSGSDWSKVSSYSSNGTQENMVFMNNMNIDYTGADSSPQGYSTDDGSATATSSTIFGGSLADASSSSTVGGGPCVSTGCEVNIMTETNCADEDGCLGYYDDMGFHGWDGGMKMFVTKVMMPTGTSVNLPAIWMLNAQVVRASQYGCNCRGSGSVGGCGELDVAEVIETNTAQDKVSTHYYFYDGDVSPGGDNYASRPTDSAVTYVTIIDNSSSGAIKIIELGGDDFDFDVDAVTAAQVTTWLEASVENLLS
ncbi:hypothetical protein BBJ28_00015540, partial [Nothophytophthora sp. Chile5]